MRTAILILCLIGAPHPSPSNQEAANPAQSEPQTDKQPSKPSLALPAEKNPTPDTTDQNGKTVASNPNERAIRVVSLPPRSTGDTVALICTMLLTIAGAVGIFVAICTLKTITRQTGATVSAARASRDAVIAMREGNQINRESLQTGQRAYVTFPFASEPKDIKVFTLNNEKGEILGRRFYLPIENTGNTPVKEMLVRINFQEFIGTDGIPENFEYPDLEAKDASPLSLGAKVRIFSGALDIVESTIQNLYAKQSRLFFWGWTTYGDVFEATPQHLTEFCHELRIMHLSGSEIGVEISGYGPHNSQS